MFAFVSWLDAPGRRAFRVVLVHVLVAVSFFALSSGDSMLWIRFWVTMMGLASCIAILAGVAKQSAGLVYGASALAFFEWIFIVRFARAVADQDLSTIGIVASVVVIAVIVSTFWFTSRRPW